MTGIVLFILFIGFLFTNEKFFDAFITGCAVLAGGLIIVVLITLLAFLI